MGIYQAMIWVYISGYDMGIYQAMIWVYIRL